MKTLMPGTIVAWVGSERRPQRGRVAYGEVQVPHETLVERFIRLGSGGWLPIAVSLDSVRSDAVKVQEVELRSAAISAFAASRSAIAAAHSAFAASRSAIAAAHSAFAASRSAIAASSGSCAMLGKKQLLAISLSIAPWS